MAPACLELEKAIAPFECSAISAPLVGGQFAGLTRGSEPTQNGSRASVARWTDTSRLDWPSSAGGAGDERPAPRLDSIRTWGRRMYHHPICLPTRAVSLEPLRSSPNASRLIDVWPVGLNIPAAIVHCCCLPCASPTTATTHLEADEQTLVGVTMNKLGARTISSRLLPPPLAHLLPSVYDELRAVLD